MAWNTQIDSSYHKEEVIKRLNSLTIKDDNGCWLFTGCLSSKGYGKIRFRGRSIMTHRLSAHLYLDYLFDDPRQVLHKVTCPNRNCWNPEHLYLGGYSDNMNDRYTVLRRR